MKIALVGACLALSTAGTVLAAEPAFLDVSIEVHKGGNHGDDPMLVFYLEDAQGHFIRTLQMFSHNTKYYKDLKDWKLGSNQAQESKQDVDAVVSPTIVWNSSGHYRIPVHIGNRNILDGNYVIRVESGRDRAGLATPTYRIPLAAGFQGGTFNDTAGYASVITIKPADH